MIWRWAGVLLAVLLLLAMTWASTAPLAIAGSDDAVVRISLGARPERIETCRSVSDAELEQIAPQMRQQMICEGTTARYDLEVRREGELLHAQLLRGGGLRHDRQLYVSRDIRVPPGTASFQVRLARRDTVATPDDESDDADRKVHEDDERDDAPRNRGEREADERRRRRDEAIPAELSIGFRAALAPREVLLVSYDPERRRLITRRDTSSSP